MKLDESFRREIMADALKAGDLATFANMLKDDEGLYSYSHVLNRAASQLKDKEQVEWMLNHPAIDQMSDDYKRAVQGVFIYMGGHRQDADAAIADILFDKIDDAPERHTRSLAFIFECAVNYGEDYPNLAIAKKLVRHGADLSQAIDEPKDAIDHETLSIDTALDRIQAFKTKILSP